MSDLINLQNTNENHDLLSEEDKDIQRLIQDLLDSKGDLKDDNELKLSQILESFSLNSANDFFIDLISIDQRLDMNAYLSNLNKQSKDRNIKKVIGIVYTLENWRKEQKILRVPVIRIPISCFYFVKKRVLPKISLLSKLTVVSKNRLYSKAEILGRFCYFGFEIENFIQTNKKYHIFVISRKNNPSEEPIQNGFFIKLPRIGKNGKQINVFKLRTMHTYAEFLHSYMIQQHGFDTNGKIKNDFRLAGWARLFRRLWIDELPQLINILRGEMKLVGVRPVSQSYFESLPKENQDLRKKQKPGCIPPYIALNIGTSKEAVLKAEMIYLDEKMRNPYFTDIKYFIYAVYNIIFKGLRSS